MSVLRFAVIGAGNIGKVHMQALSAIPQARLTVVCDQAAQARSVAEAHGADWEPNYAQAVGREDVDVVCICTPSGTHAEIADAAAQAGKHLVVEKPLDITLERADRIVYAAEQAGVKLTCIFPLRFKVGPRKAKEALDRGRLGRLAFANAFVRWHRPQAYYEGSWRGTWALDGGGALINQSIHSIDLLQWIAGPVAGVFGRTATLAHRIETEDTACAVLTFASGALGVIQGATSCWPGDPARLELFGDKGVIILEEGRIVRWELADAAPGERESMLSLEDSTGSGSADPMDIGAEMHRRQLLDFIDAVVDRRAPAVSGREARKALEIVTGIYRAAASGETVTLPMSQYALNEVNP